MRTNRLFGVTLLLVATGALAGLTGGALSAQEGEHHHHFMACAKVCSDCALECESCHHHCAHKVIEGSKEHSKSMRLCADCAEFCRLSASLSAREGPLAVVACDGCAKACDDCAASCESFKDDKHMAQCAKSCRDCAKSCRDMVKMVKK